MDDYYGWYWWGMSLDADDWVNAGSGHGGFSNYSTQGDFDYQNLDGYPEGNGLGFGPHEYREDL